MPERAFHWGAAGRTVWIGVGRYGCPETQALQREDRLAAGPRREKAKTVERLSALRHGGVVACGVPELRLLHGPRGG